MRLTETIRKVLNETLQEQIMSLIDEYGIYQALRFIGGVNSLIDALKDVDGNISREDKIDIIRYVVREHYGGVSLMDLDDYIFYKMDGDHYHRLEYLSDMVVFCNIYDEATDKDYGDYPIPYINLPNKYLDKIFDAVVKSLIKKR